VGKPFGTEKDELMLGKGKTYSTVLREGDIVSSERKGKY
jgi:hypothetical protein